MCAREKDRAIERARATEREGEQEAEDGERERDSRESKEDGSRAKDRAKQADAPWHPARGPELPHPRIHQRRTKYDLRTTTSENCEAVPRRARI